MEYQRESWDYPWIPCARQANPEIQADGNWFVQVGAIRGKWGETPKSRTAELSAAGVVGKASLGKSEQAG